MESVFTLEEESVEVKGYVVPYDLPSENVFFLRPRDGETEDERKKRESIRDYVRAKRVQATGYLHSLGVLATNSVVLVPASRVEKIDETVKKVQKIYEEVNKKLLKEGYHTIGMPIIKKIPMVQTQVIGFKELAERQLKTKLDKKIDQIANIIQKIQEGVEEGKAKKIRYNLNRTKKELENLEEIAEELGIEVSTQFALLGEMINQAIKTLEGM
ncbi:MAG: hypothetical protein DRJ03_22745 [Chloroflexi bacterium]|nr:MAG: hypothetical protein DRJ03_22745 [Chloroflexota bacterium]